GGGWAAWWRHGSGAGGGVMERRNFGAASFLGPVALGVIPFPQYEAKLERRPSWAGSSPTPFSSPAWPSKAASRNEPSMVKPAFPDRNAVTPSVRKPNWLTLCRDTRSVYQVTART